MTPPVPEQSAPSNEPVPPVQWPTAPAGVPVPGADVLAGGPPVAAEAPPKVRRRWSRKRTALLITVAVVLGAAGGGGVGYAIQAQRPPTPLPPLAGDALHYPSGRAAVPALSAEQDDAARTDGDLTRLLLSAPAGSKPSNATLVPDGYISLGDYSRDFKSPAAEFRWMLAHGFRRAVQVSWNQGNRDVVIELVQFQKANEADVKSDLQDLQSYAGKECGSDPVPVPDTGDSKVYPGNVSHSYSDGSTYHYGCGYARHGDILVDVHVYDQGQVAAQDVMSIIQNQMERL
ncbi:hypothetical protein ABIA32_000216 [Streptacidiphilus sp. MAP12-20]|uniref:hypothetical protein n=1 Tax=Streptacidiphilus sp. MAP12-20 TaxID=3156299 RepID=UPI0035126BCF